MKLTRRKVLAGLAGIAAAGIPLGHYFLGKKPDEDSWDFLKKYSEPKKWNGSWKEADVQGMVPLREEWGLPNDTEEFKRLQEEAKLELSRQLAIRGFDLRGNYAADVKTQFYGIPEHPETAEQMIGYSKDAISFLYSRLKGLQKHSLNWVVLKNNGNFAHNDTGNAYVGSKRFEVQRVYVTNTGNSKQSFKLERGEERCGSCMDFQADFESELIKKWYVFFGSGLAMMSAPFSEIIPLTTIKSTLHYSKQAGLDNAICADEAVHESLSYFLTMEFAAQQGIPKAGKMLDEATSIMISNNKRYVHLNKAINWVRRHGIQNALDLYMESPKRFMDAIQKS